MGDNILSELQKHKSISYTRVDSFLMMAAEVVKILKNDLMPYIIVPLMGKHTEHLLMEEHNGLSSGPNVNTLSKNVFIHRNACTLTTCGKPYKHYT